MKNFLTVFAFFLLLAFSANQRLQAQIRVLPLQSGPNQASGMRILYTQTDTIRVKLPYIEDFSGPQVPIQKIDTVTIDSINHVPQQGYKIINLKMHGLNTGDSINVYSIKPGATSPVLIGTKYIKTPLLTYKGQADTTYKASIDTSYNKVIDSISYDTLFKSIPYEKVVKTALDTSNGKRSNTAPVYKSNSTPRYSVPPTYLDSSLHRHITSPVYNQDSIILVNNKPDTLYFISIQDTLFKNIRIDTMYVQVHDTTSYIENDTLIQIIDTSFFTYIRYRVTRQITDTTIFHIKDTIIPITVYPDRYSFYLFDDPALTKPTPLGTIPAKPNYINWLRPSYEGYSSIPDSLGFVANNGGVTINDGFEINPISHGIATFNGINYLGIPYSNSNVNGFADVLLSLPFDLSAYTLTDSIYMSFFWQPGGLGELPDTSSFLRLEFKDNANNWIPVWTKHGGDSTLADTFMVAMIPFDSTNYLHKNFQYRFRSYGNLYGGFDVWNIDYIYIDTNRTILQPYLHDVTASSTSPRFLKNYTSIPYKHLVQYLGQYSDSLTALISPNKCLYFRNMAVRYDGFTNTDVKGISPDFLLQTHDNLGNTYPDIYQTNPLADFSFIDSTSFRDTINASFMTAPYVLKQEFSMLNVESIDQATYDMSFNNTINNETPFYDYYAYDDFSPEYTVQYKQSGANLANQYKLLVADTLTHMDFCFLRNDGPDLTNFTINMTVWDKSMTVKATQPVSISYPALQNVFTRFQFNIPVYLTADTFYFGFNASFNDVLFIGYDRNNDFTSRIFCDTSNSTWFPFKNLTTVTGALMIRPVFSKNQILTAIKNPQGKVDQFVVYPNPNNGELHFMGNPEYMTVFDLNGRQLIQESVSSGSVSVAGKLSNGLYLIYLSKGSYTEVHKLILFNE